MCTALSFYGKHHYFGRNLDLERKYDESVVIAPRNYIIKYKSNMIERRHNAIIGMATVFDGYPLYYDATNEYGLSMAGLNFVGNASYNNEKYDMINLAPYELILYILSNFSSVDEVLDNIKSLNVIDKTFNDILPNSQLHWLISDKNKSITLETMKNGINIFENHLGVLTNNPPFEFHLMNLNNYLNISNSNHSDNFACGVKLQQYSKGMGGIGLPGDNSSMSRFVRATFNKFNSVVPKNNIDCVTQFFHILGSVAQVEGSVMTNGKCDRTQYMSCCDMDDCVYYYKSYNNSQINAIKLFSENLDSENLICYKMIDSQKINYLN